MCLQTVLCLVRWHLWCHPPGAAGQPKRGPTTSLPRGKQQQRARSITTVAVSSSNERRTDCEQRRVSNTQHAEQLTPSAHAAALQAEIARRCASVLRLWLDPPSRTGCHSTEATAIEIREAVQLIKHRDVASGTCSSCHT